MKQRIIKLTVLLIALLCLLLTACGKDKEATMGPAGTETVAQEQNQAQTGTQATEPYETETAGLMPWEAEGAKQPEDYTMEEYEELTADQRKAFRNYLGAAGYAAWLERAEKDAEPVNIPWEIPGSTQPKDYTWAEYQALTEGQKKAFMEHLGPQGLEAWLAKVQDKKTENPWEVPGAKQPKDYTWTEYAALTNKQQAAFANYLGTSGFRSWLNRVQGQKETVYPWEKPGAKQPADYTWEEYEALTKVQQKAFRDHLGSDGFEVWLEKVQEEENPWEEEGAKQPEDYTWEEYTALTEAQKEAFQEYLGADSYVEWLERALQLGAYPWEETGAKQPGKYTWEDYIALTEDQQAAFQDHLGEESMKAWLRKITDIPWDEPKAKQPEDYTLEEYENLEDPQQLAFRVWLGVEEFEAWLAEAQLPKEANPWEKPGAKQPKDYTWEEFAALTVNQQMAFQNYLGESGFEAWLKKVQNQLAKYPWEKPGAKQPVDYTWAEYEALTADQQMAFQTYLGAEAFAAWLERVKPDNQPEDRPAANPWEVPGAKQPKDYTWAEFEALTAAQQMAFQNYLGVEGFTAWLERVRPDDQPDDQPETNPWEKPGAKQPADYTWEDFEALTAAQQMAFQNYLGEDGFEEWLNRVQNQTEKNPWEEPGAKQPQDYTWEEFEALTGAQQIAFQKYLGEEAFESWLNRVLGS